MDYKPQISEARAQGYTDDEITKFLASKDPKVHEAVNSGYSSKEIMSFLSPPPTTGEDVRNSAISGTVEGAPFMAAPVAGLWLGALHGVTSGLSKIADYLPEDWQKTREGLKAADQELTENAAHMARLRAQYGDVRTYQPQTPAGKFTKAGTTGLVAAGSLGPVGAAIGGVSGLTSEGAGQAAEAAGLGGTGWDTAARVVGGAIPGVIAGGVTAARAAGTKPALSRDQLVTDRNAAYTAVRDSKVQVQGEPVAAATQHALDLAEKAQATKDIPAAALTRMQALAQNKGPVHVADILQLQQELGSGGGYGAQIARDFAHHILEDIPDEAVIHGDPAAAQQLIRRGAETSKALRNYDMLKGAEERGDVSGGKVNNYNTEINRLIKPTTEGNPNKFQRTLSPDLQARLQQIAEGTRTQRVMRTIDSYLFKGRLSPGRLAAWGIGLGEGMGHGHDLGGVLGSIGLDLGGQGISQGLQRIDAGITRRAIQDLQQRALGEAPLGQGMPRPNMNPQQPGPAGLLPPPPIRPPAPPAGVAGPGFTMQPGVSSGPGRPLPTAPLALPPPQRLLPPPTIQAGAPRPPLPGVIPMGGGGGLPALRQNTQPAIAQMTGPPVSRAPAAAVSLGPNTGGRSDLGRMQMVQDKLRGVLEAEKLDKRGRKLVRSGALSRARNNGKKDEEKKSETGE